MHQPTAQYMSLAHTLITTNIAVQPKEEVLIVIDAETDFQLAMALAHEVELVGGEFTISLMPVRGPDFATTTTAVIAKSAEACDVIISLTRNNSCAVFDARVCRLIGEKKLRDVTMSLRDPKSFLEGCATANYEEILEDGIKLQKLWEPRKSFHMTSPLGTDLYGKLGDGSVMLGCGIARVAGESMAFADGEVSCTPKLDSVNGIVVIDGPIFGYRNTETPLRMTIKSGRVISIDDGDPEVVSSLRSRMECITNMDYIAELAIGLNPNSLRNGDFVEEKKAYGNLHIALGDALYFGGSIASPVHIDCVIKNATLTMDDIPFVENGIVTILNQIPKL